MVTRVLLIVMNDLLQFLSSAEKLVKPVFRAILL